ncbi:MAG: ZIP family metal transporter [Chlorobi bacterium]|nr:ZIP family metal transporter [Chlorobiota bacterium]
MTAYIWLILAVLAGGFSAFYLYRKHGLQRLLITFSGAYLFAIILFHLLPEIYAAHTHPHAHEAGHAVPYKTVGLFIMLGLLFQLVLDFFSHGIEHGHEGGNEHTALSAGVVAGLFLHAFTEGLPVLQGTDRAYLYGILVHKFPIALAMTSFLIMSGMKRSQIILLLIAFSLMSPLGAWAGRHFAFLREHHILVSAFVVGILTHISTTILFESNSDHRFYLRKMLVILLAFALAYLA